MISGRFWFPTFPLTFAGALLIASGCGGDSSQGCLEPGTTAVCPD
ncbi:hypothetical protein [Archangium sp.]|nr:hypothetical protein [Archangium sp.]HYO55792.1 hypothetical protein [Archangium sp.]